MSDSLVYPSKRGPVTVAPYAPGDEDGIRALFALTFKRERSEAEWRWLFRDNPDGFHCYLGKNEDGEVVSQFASIPTPMSIHGEDYVFGQIVDSMVHPLYRGSLKRKGLFSTTVDAFVERFGHAHEELVMMGLPNPPAFRIGRKLCGYVPMGKVYFLTKEVEPDPGAPELPEVVSHRGHEFALRVVSEFAADVDELEQRLLPRRRVAVRRTKRRLDWRYFGCPEPRYHVLELRDRGDDSLLGVVVGVAGYLDRPDGVIAEWMVDEEVTGAREALLSVVERLFRRVSMTRVQILLNHVDPQSRFFEDSGYALAPTHYTMVSRTYDASLVTPASLARDWSFTLGDFDVT